MKKCVLWILGCIILTLPSRADNNKDFEHLCKKYQDTESVESFGMDGLGCLLASWFVGKEANDVNALIRECSSFRVLTCDGEQSEALCKDIKAFVRSGRLEELISIQEEGSEVKIYIESKKEAVHQVFISVIEEDQGVFFLQVKGKFKLSAIQKLVKTSEISYLCP